MADTDKAKGILGRVELRPSPFEVVGLSFEDIDFAARELGYPIFSLGAFGVLQEKALPLIELKIKKLFLDHEKNKPDYVILGRDGFMIYDAMAMVTRDKEIFERIHLVTVSKPMADRLDKNQILEEERKIFTRGLGEYFEQRGLTREAIKKNNFVFIDSGYMGSLFDFILGFFGANREEVGERLVGYLICRADKSPYRELGWSGEPNGDFFNAFYENFGKNWEDLEDWPVEVGSMYLWDIARKTNWALANYLHIQPKYHRRAMTLVKMDDGWYSVPDLKDRVYPLADSMPWEPKDITQPIWHPNHASAVDPVAATKLQIMTAEYFSKLEVKMRVF